MRYLHPHEPLRDLLYRRLGSGAGGLTTRQAKAVVVALFGREGIITEALAAGEPVSIQGFGCFETVKRAAKRHRNPKTGEPVEKPAHRAPRFRPFGALRRTVE